MPDTNTHTYTTHNKLTLSFSLPGRLLHHLEEVTGLSLRAVEYAVLDEADRLFEMGFMEQVCEVCVC